MGTMAALNRALADRNKPKDVIHHSDHGVQYLSICYTSRAWQTIHTIMPWLKPSMGYIILRCLSS